MMWDSFDNCDFLALDSRLICFIHLRINYARKATNMCCVIQWRVADLCHGSCQSILHLGDVLTKFVSSFTRIIWSCEAKETIYCIWFALKQGLSFPHPGSSISRVLAPSLVKFPCQGLYYILASHQNISTEDRDRLFNLMCPYFEVNVFLAVLFCYNYNPPLLPTDGLVASIPDSVWLSQLHAFANFKYGLLSYAVCLA